MKKIGTVLCLSSALFVSTVQAGWEGNWLAGISGGYAVREGSFDLTMLNTAAQQTKFIADLQNKSYILGLLGGYQFICNHWLWGAEINVDWHSNQDSDNFAFTDFTGLGWSAEAAYKRDFSVGLSGRLGYQFDSFFTPYIRVGVVASRDELEYTATNTSSVTANIDDKRTVYRAMGGVGVEVPVSPLFPSMTQLTFRVEYNHLAHVSHSAAVEATGQASNGALVSAQSSPHINLIKASLIWNFG